MLGGVVASRWTEEFRGSTPDGPSQVQWKDTQICAQDHDDIEWGTETHHRKVQRCYVVICTCGEGDVVLVVVVVQCSDCKDGGRCEVVSFFLLTRAGKRLNKNV